MISASHALGPNPDGGPSSVGDPGRAGSAAPDEGAVGALLRRVVHASSEGSLTPETKRILTRIAAAAVVLDRLPQLGSELLILHAALDAASNGNPELAAGMLGELERGLRVSNHPLWSIVRGRSAALPFHLGMIATIVTMPFLWTYMQWLLLFLWDRSPQHAPLDVDAGLLISRAEHTLRAPSTSDSDKA